MLQLNDPLFIKAFYQQGDDPFVCVVQGPITIDVLKDIEDELGDLENPHGLFDKGDGDYVLIANHDPGQYGEYGQCEVAPHWDFTHVIFSPL